MNQIVRYIPIREILDFAGTSPRNEEVVNAIKGADIVKGRDAATGSEFILYRAEGLRPVGTLDRVNSVVALGILLDESSDDVKRVYDVVAAVKG